MRAPETPEDIAKREDRAREALEWKIRRLDRLRAFVASEFYVQDVRPELDAKRKDLAAGMVWRPGTSLGSIEAVALGAAYAGGMWDQVMWMDQLFDVWESDGAEALARLKKLQEGNTR